MSVIVSTCWRVENYFVVCSCKSIGMRIFNKTNVLLIRERTNSKHLQCFRVTQRQFVSNATIFNVFNFILQVFMNMRQNIMNISQMHHRTASCMHGSMKELDVQQKMAMYTVITHERQRLLLLHMTSTFMVIRFFQEQLQGSQRCGLHKCVCVLWSLQYDLY